MTFPDRASHIQSIIDAAVADASITDHMGMATYVVADFDGSGSPTAKFFFPTGVQVWDSNHNVISPENLPNTLFEIGSVTKVFTSRIFYTLQGTYVGNTIGTCMPSISLPAAISGIQIADIVSYASGFPQDNDLPPDPRGTFCPEIPYLLTFGGLVDFFTSGKNAGWICPAGECYTYSNLAWSLLAIAGMSPQDTSLDVYEVYNDLLALLCLNLGMGNTALFNTNQVARMACGYKGTTPFPVPENQNYEDYLPSAPMKFAGGWIVSSAADMLLWLLYNMGQLAPSPAEFAILQTQQQIGSARAQCGTTGTCSGQAQGPMTGIGWFFPLIAGVAGRVLSKDGSVPGFSSWMGFESWVQNGASAPSGNGVVVLAAGQNASPIGLQIMATLL